MPGSVHRKRAARTYISTHTAAHHGRQAFRKPSITSRVELTRVVIEHAADGGQLRNWPS